MIIKPYISSRSDSDMILLVDDVPNNLKVLSSLLINAGFEVSIATNGKAALEQLEHTSVSLILLDIMMPDIDGFEICRRIKANPATQNIPIIFITALSESVNKVIGFNLGAVDYITKPFQQEEVLARVKTHLNLNQLKNTLELRNLELQKLTEELEQRVMERTQELSIQKQNLEQALLELQKAQIQSEKMSALGNLVAEVAHEINNPLGFLNGNINPALDYIKSLFSLLDSYQTKFPNPGEEIESEIEDINLEYIREDLPKLISSMKAGVDRIWDISTSLRTFSRTDNDCPVAFNLHDGIDSTILILKHRLKANDIRPEIQVIKNYSQIPLIECYPGQLNQVFMNILANAIDALDESNTGRSYREIAQNPNYIKITTFLEDNYVKIVIADNGKGIPEAVIQNIFDHLFTTKGVGTGTGLGLTIARQIVEEKHSGSLQVSSILGIGTEFTITLPVKAT